MQFCQLMQYNLSVEKKNIVICLVWWGSESYWLCYEYVPICNLYIGKSSYCERASRGFRFPRILNVGITFPTSVSKGLIRCSGCFSIPLKVEIRIFRKWCTFLWSDHILNLHLQSGINIWRLAWIVIKLELIKNFPDFPAF